MFDRVDSLTHSLVVAMIFSFKDLTLPKHMFFSLLPNVINRGTKAKLAYDVFQTIIFLYYSFVFNHSNPWLKKVHMQAKIDDNLPNLRTKLILKKYIVYTLLLLVSQTTSIMRDETDPLKPILCHQFAFYA